MRPVRPAVLLSLAIGWSALAWGALAAPARAYHFEDSLRGSTTGSAVGGSFSADGWTVTGEADRIWWALPRLVSGSVEFTVTNVSAANLLVNDNEIFSMYEAGYGIPEPIGYGPYFRQNHYKMLVRIYGQAETGREGAVKLMWGMCPSGAPGYWTDAAMTCGCEGFFEEPFDAAPPWDGAPTRIRIAWADGVTRLFRDGVEIVSVDWSASGLRFAPSELHAMLGSSRNDAVDTSSMPIGAVFSDVVIDGEEGPVATCPDADAGTPDADAAVLVDAGDGAPDAAPTLDAAATDDAATDDAATDGGGGDRDAGPRGSITSGCACAVARRAPDDGRIWTMLASLSLLSLALRRARRRPSRTALPVALLALLALARLAAPAPAHAQDCPRDAVGCHRADVDFEHLDMRLPSVSLDSGWVPAGSPIQVRLGLAFMGETEVDLGGTLATYWPFGLTMGTPGRPGTGRLRMAWGLEIVARLRFSLEIAGTRYAWEGDIPFIPVRDLRLAGETVFDPFVLPGATPRPVVVSDTTDAIRVLNVGLASIIGTSIPGIDGGIEVTLTGALTTGYQTDRILISGARGPIESEGSVVQYWPPGPEGFGASEDVTVRPEGTITYEGDVIARPAVYIELLGRRFDLAAFDLSIPLVRTDTPTDFDPAAVHVPLPDVSVDPTNVDVGLVLVGDVVDRALTVRNRGEAELVVTVDALPGTLMVSSSRLAIPPASESTLGLEIAPERAGMLSETLVLRTNDPDQPVIRIPVTAEAISPDAGPADAGARDAAQAIPDAGADAGRRPSGLAGGACGCRVGTHTSPGPLHALALLALLGFALARARRR
jgi:MYXO-CTERM domain-containing protein